MSIKIWLLKLLLRSLTEDAIKADDHLLADQLIFISDAIHEKNK